MVSGSSEARSQKVNTSNPQQVVSGGFSIGNGYQKPPKTTLQRLQVVGE